jgi:glutamate 5-kinase
MAHTSDGQQLTVILGSSSIVDEHSHEPILPILSIIVQTAVSLRRDGHKVVIVSSGAIAVGLQRMHIDKRPKHLAQVQVGDILAHRQSSTADVVQALAAIGQSRLMSIWDSLFAHLNQPVAQILLTRNDIADRSQYLNAQNTLAECLSFGVIPIVNENDTLSVAEIKFGDNDTLSAITAAMVSADYLFLMTDVDCLYDKNPRLNPDAQPIKVIEDIDELQVDVSSRGSSLGTGGMATKITAARLATAAGTSTIITNSSKPGNISNIIRYLHPQPPETDSPSNGTATQPPFPLHTRFLPSVTPIRSRAFWILHGLHPHGSIFIDRGAASALSNHAGLLPVGIVGVSGVFAQQEAVRLVVVDRVALGSLSPRGDSDSMSTFKQPSMEFVDYDRGEEIGRALVNYSNIEVARIKGLRSKEIAGVLGYCDSEYVAFRENVSLLEHAKGVTSRPETPGLRTPTRESGGGVGGTTPESSISDLRDLKVAGGT